MSRASMIPGVEAAGISDNLPMSRNRSWGIAAKGEQKRNALGFHSCVRVHCLARLPEGDGNAPEWKAAISDGKTFTITEA